MKISKTAILGLLAGCVFLAVISSGVAVAQTCCEERGFIVPLPQGWAQIPDETIKLFSKKVHQLNPNVPPQTFHYAFQPQPGKQWFSYPYVLVQVLETGRVEPAKLQQLQQLPSRTKRVSEKLQDEFASVLSGLKLGEAGYDTEQKIVWSKSSSRIASIGEVQALSGSILTSRGAVVVHCYATSEQFTALLPAFEGFVRGIQLKPELKF